jgi:hypothetical protein
MARVCSFPAPAHYATSSPLAHEGMALRVSKPETVCEAFYPSSGPEGYLSPTQAYIERSLIDTDGRTFLLNV